MNSKLSIGEMAKLHNISVKALRYYDEIGLFKPIEIDKNTGYRQYSVVQFEKLNTINYLKYLGVPLLEIKKHLETNDINYFINILKREKEIADEKIAKLTEISKKIEKRITDVEDARQIIDIGMVKVEKIKKRRIISLKDKISTVDEIELSIRNLDNQYNMTDSIMIGHVGFTISKSNILKEVYNEYASVYILVDDDLNNHQEEYIRSGTFATLYYRGDDHKESPKWYKVIKDYVQKNNYEINGDAIERVIIDKYISKDENDYLTEIQIPIKKT